MKTDEAIDMIMECMGEAFTNRRQLVRIHMLGDIIYLNAYDHPFARRMYIPEIPTEILDGYVQQSDLLSYTEFKKCMNGKHMDADHRVRPIDKAVWKGLRRTWKSANKLYRKNQEIVEDNSDAKQYTSVQFFEFLLRQMIVWDYENNNRGNMLGIRRKSEITEENGYVCLHGASEKKLSKKTDVKYINPDAIAFVDCCKNPYAIRSDEFKPEMQKIIENICEQADSLKQSEFQEECTVWIRENFSMDYD